MAEALMLYDAGSVTATDVYAPDGLAGRRVGSWTHFAFDPQGNAAQRLDSSGGVRSASTYDAYGNETVAGTLYADAFGHGARWGYYLDRQTGLCYCQHRYYGPAAGRWLNRDPIGYAGGVDLHAYCGGGPVGWMGSLGYWGYRLTYVLG